MDKTGQEPERSEKKEVVKPSPFDMTGASEEKANPFSKKLLTHSLFYKAFLPKEDEKPAGSAAAKTAEEDDTVLEIHRHPFGLVILYTQTIFGILVAIILLLAVGPHALISNTANAIIIFGGLTFFALAILAIMLFIATYVYRETRLVVNNNNLTQFVQRGLFSTRVSRLSMVNVEDVSAEQRGFFATMLNYGTLRIETAGEQESFIFSYCPNPTHYAGEILAARQQFVLRDVEKAAHKLTHHNELHS